MVGVHLDGGVHDVGTFMLLSSALQQINGEVQEAAMVDGANANASAW